MSHGITDTDGTMYVGEVPWHGLGTRLDSEATAAEAMEAAELDWDVELTDIYIHNGAYGKVADYKAIIRPSTHKAFAIVGNRYRLVQNREAFEFFDDVVGAGAAIYHTAGSLHGGKRLWILAKITGDNMRADNGDEIMPFVLLSNSHDATSALTVKLTPVRVVCANTLSVAMGSGNAFYGRHTAGLLKRAVEVREFLGLTSEYYKNFMLGVNQLLDTRVTSKKLSAVTETILGIDDLDKASGSKLQAYDVITDGFYSGEGNKGETAWDLFNSVTQYVDHSRPVRGKMDTLDSTDNAVVDKRIEASWFGTSGQLRQRAWDVLNTYNDSLMEVSVA
jgi:phage/plasmid-like protein (TIGR03299 family)